MTEIKVALIDTEIRRQNIYDLSTLETYKRKGYAWILLNYIYGVAKEHTVSRYS